MLDFARLGARGEEIQFRECDLVGVARDTAETYRPHLENNGFKLDCRLGGRAAARSAATAMRWRRSS